MDNVEEQVIFAARGICGLRRIVGFMLQAKPALQVDLCLAFGSVAPKVKVQTHRKIPPGSTHSSHLVHGPVTEHCLAVNIVLTDRAKITAVVG